MNGPEENPTTENEPFHSSFCGSCDNCTNVTPYLREIAGEYFETGKYRCRHCSSDIDLWRNAVSRVASIPFASLMALGAVSTSFGVQLQPGQKISLKFSDYGIPSEAVILGMNYTPQGSGCWPLEFHGNNPSWGRYHKNHVILIGVQPFKDEPAETRILVTPTWIEPDQELEGWFSLIDAFAAVGAKRYLHAIVPANAALESTLMPIMQSILEKDSGGDRVRDFLGNHCTYSHCLNILLPLFCRLSGAPQLFAHISSPLNRLRKLRNSVAHGQEQPEVDDRTIAELIGATVFGMEYLRYIRPIVLKLAQ